MLPYLIFLDIETGGIDPAIHPIIQLGAVAYDVEADETKRQYEAKLMFDRADCDDEALEKNSFDATLWHEWGVPFSVGLQGLADFMKPYCCVQKTSKRGNAYAVCQVVAHNAKFEADFVIPAFQAMNIFLPADYRFLCTMQYALWKYRWGDAGPEPPSYQLSDLHQHIFGEPADEHDALEDAMACCRVYRELIKPHVKEAFVSPDAGRMECPE